MTILVIALITLVVGLIITIVFVTSNGGSGGRSDSVQARYIARVEEVGDPSELTHVVIACDKSRYLDYWPEVYEAWKTRMGLEPTLVYVDEDPPPPTIPHARNVRWFPVVPGVPKVFTAQCIRLLYPGHGQLPESETAAKRVIISDMDILPMDRNWFHDMALRTPKEMVTNYRPDALRDLGEIPMCYVAARPEVWRDLFPIEETMAIKIKVWYERKSRSEIDEWCTDQRLLYEALRENHPNLEFDHAYPQLRRLDKTNVCSTNIDHESTQELSDAHLPPKSDCPDTIRRLSKISC